MATGFVLKYCSCQDLVKTAVYLAEVVDIIQRLQQRVHVACSTLILEPNIASGFFAVIVHVLWPFHFDNHIHPQGVIDQETRA